MKRNIVTLVVLMILSGQATYSSQQTKKRTASEAELEDRVAKLQKTHDILAQLNFLTEKLDIEGIETLLNESKGQILLPYLQEHLEDEVRDSAIRKRKILTAFEIHEIEQNKINKFRSLAIVVVLSHKKAVELLLSKYLIDQAYSNILDALVCAQTKEILQIFLDKDIFKVPFICTKISYIRSMPIELQEIILSSIDSNKVLACFAQAIVADKGGSAASLIVKILAKRGITHFSLLWQHAVRNNDIPLALLFLYGGDVAETFLGEDPLARCFQKDSTQMAYLLLMHNVPLTKFNNTEQQQQFDRFVKKVVGNYCDNTLINEIIFNDNENSYCADQDKCLFDLEKTVTSRLKSLAAYCDAFKMTLLHWAAARGRLKTVQCLLKLKADVFAKNIYGKTALDLAIFANHIEIAQLLYNLMYSSILDALPKIEDKHLLPEEISSKIIKYILPKPIKRTINQVEGIFL